ncbi:MAG: 4Fe-4S dicluster domain-containing protein [Acidobacteriota bacterium]
MQIDVKKCVTCGNCISVCPMGAIYIDPKINRATINYDECVECGACFRGMSQEQLNPTFVRTVRGLAKLFRFRFEPEPDVCPTAAFVMEDLTWPRVVRRAFSDPLVEHKSTGIHGRGTEEVKTNDVTNRVGIGEVGYVIEFGRPGVGVRFHHIQTMTMALAELGITFEPKNPVTHLMTDKAKGKLKDDILKEKILSAIVELKTGIDLVPQVLDTVMRVSKEIDTVIAVGVSTRCDENGQEKLLAPLLEERGYTFHRAKTNMGLGRITNIQKKEEVSDQYTASIR